MEKLFRITWEDDLGEEWMNADILKTCILTPNHAMGKVSVEVEQMKDSEEDEVVESPIDPLPNGIEGIPVVKRGRPRKQ